MKKVIVQFETDKQAAAFFGIFSDIGIEDMDKADESKYAANSIMGLCDVYHVSTIENEKEYSIICI